MYHESLVVPVELPSCPQTGLPIFRLFSVASLGLYEHASRCSIPHSVVDVATEIMVFVIQTNCNARSEHDIMCV